MPPIRTGRSGIGRGVREQHIADNEPYLLKWPAAPAGRGVLAERVRRRRWVVDSVPGLLLSAGGRDGYPNPPLRLFANLGVPKKVLVGPWNHAYPDGAIPGPRIDHLNEVVRWLDHWCKGVENGVMDEPPVVVWMQAVRTRRSSTGARFGRRMAGRDGLAGAGRVRIRILRLRPPWRTGWRTRLKGRAPTAVGAAGRPENASLPSRPTSSRITRDRWPRRWPVVRRASNSACQEINARTRHSA